MITTMSTEKHIVPADERPYALQRHFGMFMLNFEQSLFTFMRNLSKDYDGGEWVFNIDAILELRNEMAPLYQSLGLGIMFT